MQYKGRASAALPSFSGKPREQRADELDAFVDLLIEHQVDSYLEIGLKFGDTLHFVGSHLPKEAIVVGIDLPQGDGRGYILKAVEDLNRLGKVASAYLEDSHSFSIRDKVARPFGAVLIDGDHSSGGVMADYLLYGPLGNIVAFHDINSQSAVRLLWQELKQRYPTQEIGKGFGILIKE